MWAPRKAGWDDGGCLPWWSPLGGEVEGATARSLARVGACADELRLMGVERADVSILVGRMRGGDGSLSSKAWLVAGVGSRAVALLQGI